MNGRWLSLFWAKSIHEAKHFSTSKVYANGQIVASRRPQRCGNWLEIRKNIREGDFKGKFSTSMVQRFNSGDWSVEGYRSSGQMLELGEDECIDAIEETFQVGRARSVRLSRPKPICTRNLLQTYDHNWKNGSPELTTGMLKMHVVYPRLQTGAYDRHRWGMIQPL